MGVIMLLSMQKPDNAVMKLAQDQGRIRRVITQTVRGVMICANLFHDGMGNNGHKCPRYAMASAIHDHQDLGCTNLTRPIEITANHILGLLIYRDLPKRVFEGVT